MFPSAKTGGPLENGRYWFDEPVLKAWIKNFRWRELRHKFARWLRTEGAPRNEFADVFGHKSLTMTTRYEHLSPNESLAVVSLLSLLSPTVTTTATGEYGSQAANSEGVVK